MRSLILTLGLLLSPLAQADVWTTTRRWDDRAEQLFAKYIETLPLDYFSRDDHPWGRLSTDCADAVYALRIIFASQNGLPVSFSTWQGAKTNAMKDFDTIKDPVLRVRKFIAHVNEYTNTETLAKDTYPIAIRPGLIRPGQIFLHKQGDSETPLTYRAGHAYYLQQVQENGIIRYVSSTVPAEIRKLNIRYGLNFAPMTMESGYRAFRWPDSQAQPLESHEQFQLGGWYEKSYRDSKMWYQWQREILAQFRVRPPTTYETLRAQLDNLKVQIVDRIFGVIETQKAYQAKYGAQGCMTEKDYKNYSTPTRDHKIQVELQHFALAAKAYVREKGGDPDNTETMKAFYEQFEFTILKGKTITANQLRKAFLTKTALQISEPEHTPEQRWGLVSMQVSDWTCPERAKNYVGGQ